MNQPGRYDRSTVRVLPKQAYTPWFTRAVAWIIDAIPSLLLIVVGLVIELATRETQCLAQITEYDIGPVCVTGNTWLGLGAFLASIVLAALFVLWNNGYRQGTTGSSIGKSVMKFKVVGEQTGQPIGFGRSVLRQLAHLVDTLICYIGYLFPLWDGKRQTLADKLLKTVCLPRS